MRKYILTAVIWFYTAAGFAQNRSADSTQLSFINLPRLDSMERLLAMKEEDDTSKANFLGLLSFAFAFNQAEKSVMYGQRGVQLSRHIGYKKGVAYCTRSLAWGLWGVGNYSNALQTALNALHIYEELKDEENIAFTYYTLANIYRDFGDYKRALAVAQKGFKIYKTRSIHDLIGNAIIGSIYDLQNRLDSASFYVRKAVELDRKTNEGKWGWLYYLQGNIQRKLKQYDSAMFYYSTALPLVANKDIVETFNGIAILYKETGKVDSSISYATEVLQKWRYISYQRGILQAANILADAYKMINQRDSTIKYLELSVALNSKLFNQEKERDIQNMAFNEQMRQDEILREREQNRNRLRTYALITSGAVFLIIAILLWRNNRHKQKAKEKIEKAYRELKSTQQQLIQSEKMASLGELTAGIAHEIQNPLNFVNNFSEVNSELIAEMREEIKKGNYDEANALAKDVEDNQEKINHHGKRADAIVKGMLQHSRSSSGVKEPTNINALADEYLRLAYHGLRAKDKDFNATMKTDYDESIEDINIIPQDIGRVILNLITNAFYAVTEKKKQEPDGYEPTVSVSTKKIGYKAEIKVRDNGNGVPQKVLDKIFQPFFTTKPTGRGTGLGLSLSYDIVKAHGGEIRAKTKEGEGAEFIIQLPITTKMA
jgi:two-component system NtrC family sensor kinase